MDGPAAVFGVESCFEVHFLDLQKESKYTPVASPEPTRLHRRVKPSRFKLMSWGVLLSAPLPKRHILLCVSYPSRECGPTDTPWAPAGAFPLLLYYSHVSRLWFPRDLSAFSLLLWTRREHSKTRRRRAHPKTRKTTKNYQNQGITRERWVVGGVQHTEIISKGETPGSSLVYSVYMLNTSSTLGACHAVHPREHLALPLPLGCVLQYLLTACSVYASSTGSLRATSRQNTHTRTYR